MDIMGITLYKNSGGADYYTTDMVINCAEAAAAVDGKHLWMVEQDASVDRDPMEAAKMSRIGCNL